MIIYNIPSLVGQTYTLAMTPIKIIFFRIAEVPKCSHLIVKSFPTLISRPVLQLTDLCLIISTMKLRVETSLQAPIIAT